MGFLSETNILVGFSIPRKLLCAQPSSEPQPTAGDDTSAQVLGKVWVNEKPEARLVGEGDAREELDCGQLSPCTLQSLLLCLLGSLPGTALQQIHLGYILFPQRDPVNFEVGPKNLP